MRATVLFLLLLSAAACNRNKSAPPPPAAASVAVGPPAPLVFEDAGDEAHIAFANAMVLTLRPVGPSLIAIGVGEGAGSNWKTIEIERRVVGRDAGEELAQVDTITRPQHSGHHLAAPGATYSYRARLGDKGAWTAPVNVRTADPKLAPPPPSSVHAAPHDRYSIELGWRADLRAVNGLAVEEKREGAWISVAVVDVESQTFVHNLLLPKSAHEYRIATFNEHGKSAFVETGVARTLDTPLKPTKPRALAPCTKLRPEKEPALDLPRAEITVSGGPTLISDSRGGGVRQLFGQYKGCLRDMGTFQLQGDVFVPLDWTDDGFPLLRGVEGAGQYVGAGVGLFAFSDGHYEEVNAAHFCGDPPNERDPKDPRLPDPGSINELTGWRGPFDVCQLDFPH